MNKAVADAEKCLRIHNLIITLPFIQRKCLLNFIKHDLKKSKSCETSIFSFQANSEGTFVITE